MKNDKMRPYTVMCTDIYLLIMLVVFPLYYADGYFHLPERKAEFYSTATLIYIIVTLLGVAITAFAARERWSLEAFKKNITGTDICMFGFLISNIIALTMSNDVANSWTGQSSRYYGAKVLILVCVSYFLISRYAWINKVFITAFLIGGNGVCLLATFDYFGMDVLGINKQMQPADWLVFISTMGNANTCASYVCMALAGAIVYFCVAKDKKTQIFAGISIMNCSAALITARSDSAFVGIGVIIILLGILAFSRKLEKKPFIIMLLLLDIGFFGFFIVRKIFSSRLLDEQYEYGIPKMLNKPIILITAFAFLCIFYVIIIWIEKKKIEYDKRKICGALCVMSLLIVILLFCNKENLKNVLEEGMGSSVYNVIHMFDEEMETSFKPGTRVYTYQRAVFSYLQLPLHHKIFGCGQASISSFYNKYYGNELAIHGISINSAHSHILDYLITMGMLGVICYLGSICFVIKHVFQVIKKEKYILVVGGILIAYFAQGLFNIDQTNTTTIFWIILACCEAMYRQYIIKKEEIK